MLSDLSTEEVMNLQHALADFAEHDVEPDPAASRAHLLARIGEMAGSLTEVERSFGEAIALAVALDIPLRTIAQATRGRVGKDTVRVLALQHRQAS